MELKSYLKQKAISALVLYFSYLLIEAILYIFIYKNVFSNYFILDILFGLILTSLVFLIPSIKYDKIYSITLIFFISFISILNINYFHVFGDMFSLHYISLAFKGITLLNISFLHFPSIILIMILFILFIILKLKVIKYDEYKKVTPNKKVMFGSILFTIGLFLISIFLYVINVNKYVNIEKEKEDPIVVDAVTIYKNNNIKKYGVMTYYCREINYLIKNKGDTSIEPLIDKFLSNSTHSNNKYSGLLKDYNVITIMIETGSTLMVNETLTPTLYELLQNGINCTNNSSKNKTNVSEMIGICGSYPSMGLNEESNELHYFALPEMINNEYNTIYVHATGGEGVDNRDLYNRKDFMKRLGFKQTYFFEDLHPEDDIWSWSGNYTLDSKTMEVVTNICKEEKDKFYMFYTSLSMHGPYVESENQELLEELYLDKLNAAKLNGQYINPIEQKYYDELDDENLSNDAILSEDYKCIDYYMLCCMDFDKGLKTLIDGLKEDNKLDNTLIVLYGDHELYYSGYENKPLNFILSGYEDYTHYDMYQTVLGFYNPLLNETYKQEFKVNAYTNFTSPYVIVPTILDLIGYKYNNNLYLGKSIFDSDYTLNDCFYSLELTSFFNSHYYSYDSGEIINTYILDSNEQLESMFLNQVKNIIKKQAILDYLYSNDYFDKYNYYSYIK